MNDGEQRSVALYVHWPFCVTKCPYCDFNSHVRANVDEARWRAALLADLAHEAEATSGCLLTSIFFGGGTPSLMPPAIVAALIDAATSLWPTDAEVEITLEANPSSVEAARFSGFAHAGVNRVSLGLQALDDDALRMLGRPHSLAEGLAALDTAQAHLARVSIDLIHSRPGQTLESWSAELVRALGFGTSHLSAYQLTIEPGTRFASLFAKGLLSLPPDDAAANMYIATGALCAAAGLPLYEISNHARPGDESRHNLQYWRYGWYVGIGPGAHGRRNGRSTQRLRRPEAWMVAVERDGHGIEVEQPLLPAEAGTEALLMGLRLRDGICPDQFLLATGTALDSCVNGTVRAELALMGLLEGGRRLAISQEGRPITNRLIAMLHGA